MKIALMTLRTLSRNYLGSAEASADLAQVQDKRASLAGPKTNLPEPPPTLQPGTTPPVLADVVERSA
jgi:hypothetical protein